MEHPLHMGGCYGLQESTLYGFPLYIYMLGVKDYNKNGL